MSSKQFQGMCNSCGYYAINGPELFCDTCLTGFEENYIIQDSEEPEDRIDFSQSAACCPYCGAVFTGHIEQCRIWVCECQKTDIEKLTEREAKLYSESISLNNKFIGHNRAEQQTAYIDSLISQKERKNGAKFPKYYWITINPKSDYTDHNQFLKLLNKVFKRAWIESSIFTLEYAEKMHCHALIKTNNKNYALANARRSIGDGVKHICAVNIPACFYMVELSEDIAKTKIPYLLLIKAEEKQPHVETTKIWRKANNIKDIYQPRGALINLLPPSELSTKAEGGLAHAEDSITTDETEVDFGLDEEKSD